MENFAKILSYIHEECIRVQTQYITEYFLEAESEEAVEIRFKSSFKKEYNKDFIQLNNSGIHYWNDYKEEYTAITITELKIIINAVFI